MAAPLHLQTALSLRTEQRLALVPRMLQSIEILQLSVQELVARIDAELERNEVLELRDGPTGAEHPPEAEAPSHGAAERLRGAVREEEDRPLPRGSAEDEDPKLALLQNLPAGAEDLLDSIRLQLAWLQVSGPLRDAVLALAERLDQRGILGASDAELAEAVGEDVLPAALATLRALEPRGIGARDPVELLILQLRADDPDRPRLERLLREHLADLARGHLAQIARATGWPLADVQDLVERVRSLDPHPLAGFDPRPAGVLRPDVEVRVSGGEIEVRVDDHDLPSLGINALYRDLAQDRHAERAVREYLRAKLESARNLISAVEQRRRTLARVARAIFARQKGFLERGRAGLRPLKMSEVAAELGLHVSTVSRAIAGKHVATDFGTLPLRAFFDGRESDTPGEGAAGSGREGIKEQIAGLIRGEDPHQPLSDDGIVALLAARGIRVARRTVAKYRTDLGIPATWQRKRFTP